MIGTLLIQAFIIASAYLLMKQQRVRDHLVGAAALALSISLKTADELYKFARWCVLGAGLVTLTFAAGLGLRSVGLHDAGNGIVTFTFTLVGVTLGIFTIVIGVISRTAANAMSHTKASIANAGSTVRTDENRADAEALDKAIKGLKAQFPQQEGLLNAIQASIGSWGVALFNLQAVRQLLALPHTLLLDSLEGITKAVSTMAHGVLGALIWLFISGFIAMCMPDAASAKLILIATYGLLTLLAIALHQGKEFIKKHNLPSLWWTGYRVVRLGVRTAIVAMVFATVHAALQPALPHWLVGARNRLLIAEEQLAKSHHGQNFDQRIYEVIDPGLAYWREIPVGKTVPVTLSRELPTGTLLWRTDRESFEYRPGVLYGEYALQVPEGLNEPSDMRVLFPVSKVQTRSDLALATARLDSGTAYYPDSLGVASGRLYVATFPRQAEVTSRTDYIRGVLYVLCRTSNRGHIRTIWVKAETVKSASRI